MLRFSGGGTVRSYGVTVAEEFDVRKKFKLEILRFQSQYSLLTGIKVVLHQKSFYNMMRATIISGISILAFVPSCDKLHKHCHFLNILNSEVLL